MAKPSDDIKKKAEQRYMILQMISSQIQELQKELESIEGKSSDLSNLRASLGTLSSTKEGAKALSPVGLGIFAESELKSTSHVFVGVGAGVMVKKNCCRGRRDGWQAACTSRFCCASNNRKPEHADRTGAGA